MVGILGLEAGVHENGSGLGVDLMNLHPTRQTKPATTQKTPQAARDKQKPAPWVNHDAGLSVRLMVGLAGFEPTTP